MRRVKGKSHRSISKPLWDVIHWKKKEKKNRNVGLYTLTYSLAARLKYTCTVYMPIFYFFIEPRLFFKCLLYSTRWKICP
jgi:hypothetical protein